MSGQSKRVREVTREIERAGAVLVEHGYTGSGHQRWTIGLPDGRQVDMITPVSPSGSRMLMKVRSFVKRQLR